MKHFKRMLCIVVRNTIRTLPVAALSIFIASVIHLWSPLPVIVAACFALFVALSVKADVIHESNRLSRSDYDD